MRFSIQLPTERVAAPDEFLSAAAIGEMAEAAERAGFDACYVTEHPMPDDRWLASGGHHALDPFVALSFAAAATKAIRLQTHILVAAYRNPFLTAKAVASLDVLSGGRMIVGIAAGYLRGEFDALGADFEARNELADECIATMKRAWSETGLVMTGRGFAVAGNSMLPPPVQQPHPPIWVGGNSKRAIRRAVELGDGWLPFPAPARLAGRIRTAPLESLDDLAARLDYAREHAKTVGRVEPLDVCFVPFGYDMASEAALDAGAFLDESVALERIGVTWLTLALPCRTRAEFCEKVAVFGEQVIEAQR